MAVALRENRIVVHIAITPLVVMALLKEEGAEEGAVLVLNLEEVGVRPSLEGMRILKQTIGISFW